MPVSDQASKVKSRNPGARKASDGGDMLLHYCSKPLANNIERLIPLHESAHEATTTT